MRLSLGPASVSPRQAIYLGAANQQRGEVQESVVLLSKILNFLLCTMCVGKLVQVILIEVHHNYIVVELNLTY